MKDKVKKNIEDIDSETTEVTSEEKNQEHEVASVTEKEYEILKLELETKTKQCAEYMNLLQRSAAEFDNYKKRTIREKETLYADAVSDVVEAFLPVSDSVDRALNVLIKDSDVQVVKEGVELIKRQFNDVLKNIGVEEIVCLNENFDPKLHNAVMHVEDENYGENIVVEEFQKGYIFRDKVIRHSVVKVAN